MTKNKIQIAILAGIASLSVSSARADIALGVDFAPGSASEGVGSSWTLGYEFQVTSTVTVIGLATFDANGPDGLLSSPVPVGLWADGGALLASATIPSGTLDVGLGSFAGVSIAPVTLTPGYYDVGSYDAGNDYAYSPISYTIAPGITLVDDRYSDSGEGFNYPEITENYISGGNGPAWLGGNIIVETPEPSQVVSGLVLAGLGGLSLLKRRLRSRQ